LDGPIEREEGRKKEKMRIIEKEECRKERIDEKKKRK
jgi:hypothetical protein